jgi:outer membrane protein assembly factor BamB
MAVGIKWCDLMKKYALVMMAVYLAAPLAACGGGGSSGTASSTSSSTPSPPTPTPPAPTPTPPTPTPPTPTPPAPTPPAPAPPSAPGTNVLTYKNDSNRSGQNLTETTLTPSNVVAASFGLLRMLAVDGKVDAQPLYLSQFSLSGATHNVVYAATEHDSVYAFDPNTGAVLWKTSLLGAGETTSDSHGCGQVVPEIGVTSTPVIDRSVDAHGAIFVVAMSKSGSTYHQRLHALDLATGAELLNGPADVAATYPATGGATVAFDPGQYEERAALLVLNGSIYTSWTSHCDDQPYTGWIIAYSASSLARGAVLNVAPNSGGRGPAIWMSGGGPAADAAGNLYVLTANGVFETTLTPAGFPTGQDYGNSFLKLSAAGGILSVADYFALSNTVAASAADRDLGSGGVMLLPDMTDSGGTLRHLMVGAGKDGNIYVVNRDSLGKFSASANNIYQQLNGVLPGGVWSTPAYFNGNVYYADSGGTLKAFAITASKLSAAPTSQSAVQFTYPGSAPSVSANGTANAIVWAHENAGTAVLHAYDAGNLMHELYNSNQAANNRDHFGTGNKYITPTVADGKVFVGTTSGVAVFGLLP